MTDRGILKVPLGLGLTDDLKDLLREFEEQKTNIKHLEYTNT